MTTSYENTLIYNELWRGICEGDPTSTKPTDATALAKWELQNEKELALSHSLVYDYLCIHIENTSSASTGWEQLKKKLILHLFLRELTYIWIIKSKIRREREDALEYISRVKNIHLDIIKGGYGKLEYSFLISILINGLPKSYRQFIETLQIVDKLTSSTFDSSSEMLTKHSKTFGKQKQFGEDVLFNSSSKGENSTGRGRGHDQSSFRGSGRGQSQGRSNDFQGSNFQ